MEIVHKVLLVYFCFNQLMIARLEVRLLPQPLEMKHGEEAAPRNLELLATLFLHTLLWQHTGSLAVSINLISMSWSLVFFAQTVQLPGFSFPTKGN